MSLLSNFLYANVQVHEVPSSVTVSKVFSCESFSEGHCKTSCNFLMKYNSFVILYLLFFSEIVFLAQ
jgi:hypothetical protein